MRQDTVHFLLSELTYSRTCVFDSVMKYSSLQNVNVGDASR